MTNAELIAELQKYPSDAQVIVTWEGTTHGIDTDSIYMCADGVLAIDADDNFYRDEFVRNGAGHFDDYQSSNSHIVFGPSLLINGIKVTISSGGGGGGSVTGSALQWPETTTPNAPNNEQ